MESQYSSDQNIINYNKNTACNFDSLKFIDLIHRLFKNKFLNATKFELYQPTLFTLSHFPLPKHHYDDLVINPSFEELKEEKRLKQLQYRNGSTYCMIDEKKTTERKPDFSVASLLNLSLEEEDEDDDSTPSSKSQVIETSEVGQQKANNKKKKKELVLQCPKCNKTFNRNWLLKGHLRTHTGEKPFECNLCKKSFADKSNLRAHKQTHNGFKQFECKYCQRKFALKSYLSKHKESACGKHQRAFDLQKMVA